MEKGEESKKNHKTESKQWADLHENPLRLIMKKLSCFRDQVRSSMVCKNWHAKSKGIRPADSLPLPWLFSYRWVIKSKPYPNMTLETNLYDPYSQKTYHRKRGNWRSGINFRDCAEPIISKHGWLIFANKISYDTTFFLYNPFSSKSIWLPSLKYDIDVITFSKNPTSSECVFFVSYRDHGNTYIASYSHDHKNWRSQMVDVREKMLTAVYSEEKGEFYCLLSGGILASITFRGQTVDGMILLAKRSHIEEYQNYLVEYEGQLLLVVGNYRFTVLRFDWSQLNWVAQNSLDNGAIFLNSSRFFASAVSAGKAKGVEDRICLGNQRYFDLKIGENYFSTEHYNLADWTFGRSFWFQLP